MIENAQLTGEIENNVEWRIIYAEWYAEDECRSAMLEEIFGENTWEENDV